jgi:hypothetical protein
MISRGEGTFLRIISWTGRWSLLHRPALTLQPYRIRSLAILCGLVVTISVTTGRAQESARLPDAAVPQAANAPLVSYEGGQLEITAHNSTISDVLAAVHAQTGAKFDMPVNLSETRLAEIRLGPGPAREVLASFLNSIGLDYVIQSPKGNPQGIQDVILLARSNAPVAAKSARSTSPTSPVRPGTSRTIIAPDADTGGLVDTDSAAMPTPTVAGAMSSAAEPTHPIPESNATQPRFRTTQEMIQQLQNMYQQRMQNPTAQRPPSATAPVPDTSN